MAKHRDGLNEDLAKEPHLMDLSRVTRTVGAFVAQEPQMWARQSRLVTHS